MEKLKEWMSRFFRVDLEELKKQHLYRAELDFLDCLYALEHYEYELKKLQARLNRLKDKNEHC